MVVNMASPKIRTDILLDDDKRIRPQASLTEDIRQKLRWNLASGIYLPGTRLSTRGLAKEFGTSVMPVRDALKQLVAERILVVERQSAFRVPVISRARGVQLFEIRTTLEMLATRNAVPSLTDAHADLLGKFCNDMAAALERGDVQGYFAANYSFHFLIYSATRNPDLVAMIEGLWMQIGPFYAAILDTSTRADYWQIYHEQAIAAIRAGDAEEAARAIARDINSARDFFCTC
ncbi:GntR family transcriptional regulator [Gemmobacter fulvus]|nr:FCD domain-containing protein [Gemmobacter fulvus]